MKQDLRKPHLDPMTQDTNFWKMGDKGIFSSKSIYFQLSKVAATNLDSPDCIRGVWKGFVPTKIEVFAWFSLLGKLNTKDRLIRLGLLEEEQGMCEMCRDQSETLEHLFLHCGVAEAIWGAIFQTWDTNWCNPQSLRAQFESWLHFPLRGFTK